MSRTVDEPIVFVGMPRSGTTVMFEAFSRHPHLGGPTVYTREFPRIPQFGLLVPLLDNRFVSLRGRKRQHTGAAAFNRLLPKTGEAYPWWDRCTRRDFHWGFLLGDRAEPEVRRDVQEAAAAILRWQRRRRFAAKTTGPARIGFLLSIFPDARFVHVIRDGRAVVHSLLNVAFWRECGGLERPMFQGGLTPEDLAPWRDTGDAAVLAAIQWRRVIELGREEAEREAGARYTEVRYEDFVADPVGVTEALFGWCGLPPTDRARRYLTGEESIVPMPPKYLADWPAERLAQVEKALEPLLSRLGYG